MQEESQKEFEKLRKNGDDKSQKKIQEVRERIQISFQNTEHQVLSYLAENSNQEAAQLQTLKNLLSNLHKIDNSLNEALNQVIENSSKMFENLDVENDFKDIITYEKKPSINLTLDLLPDNHETEEDHKESEGNVSLSDIIKKFRLGPESSFVDSFSCALSQKFLLQGRMYLTTTHICFHSYFNSSTIFGRETLIAIPFAQIKKIDKRMHGLIFDNAISIETEISEFIFASFFNRVQAKATIENLMKMNRPVGKISAELKCEFKIECRFPRSELGKLMKGIKISAANNPEMKPNSLYKSSIISALEFDVPPKKVFELLFSDISTDFFSKYLTMRRDCNFTVGT